MAYVLKLTSLEENKMWSMQNQGLGQGFICLLNFKGKFSHLSFYLHSTLLIYLFAQIFFYFQGIRESPLTLLSDT